VAADLIVGLGQSASFPDGFVVRGVGKRHSVKFKPIVLLLLFSKGERDASRVRGPRGYKEIAMFADIMSEADSNRRRGESALLGQALVYREDEEARPFRQMEGRKLAQKARGST